jgi:hypothetical protein
VEQSVLEPSCGDGAFLDALLTRLLEAERLYRKTIEWDDPLFDTALCAVDIAEQSVEAARQLIIDRLRQTGCPASRARALSLSWTLRTDFLLCDFKRRFDLVVGNPPYVRLEGLPKTVLREYRMRYATLTDRADLYIAFFERGLQLLQEAGTLAFISANRFVKNQYGSALRRLISEKFHVRYYVNLEHTQPFLQTVSAYPAIVVIDRQIGKPTRAVTFSALTSSTLKRIRSEARTKKKQEEMLTTFESWYSSDAPWVTTNRTDYEVLAKIENCFPYLEHSGEETRVGIGVATGADRVFILTQKREDVEESRQIPLLMAADVRVDSLLWSGHYLVNPFSAEQNGALVDLAKYPGLRAYLNAHEEELKRRHIARARPQSWYRTIDRIWTGLREQPKLVIPDIQPGGVIGFDEGHFYPHHNLYWISSAEWDLRALQALLRSRFILLQVRAFSVQMRGGSLRYQAQTLRQLRLPTFRSLAPRLVDRLVSVATSKNQQAIDEVAAEAFGALEK